MESRRMGMFAGGALIVVAAAALGASRIMAQAEPPFPGPGNVQGPPFAQQPMMMQRPMGGGVAMTALAGNIYVLQGARLLKIDAGSLRVTGEAEIPQLRGPMNPVGPGGAGQGRRPAQGPGQGQGQRRGGGGQVEPDGQ